VGRNNFENDYCVGVGGVAGVGVGGVAGAGAGAGAGVDGVGGVDGVDGDHHAILYANFPYFF